MNEYLIRGILLVMGYLLGCFHTAYILGKKERQIDIRDYGSGNSGTTNALRVMGKKQGIITLIGDMLKSVIAVVLAKVIFPGNDAFPMWAGLGVIMGHNFPFYMQFKGGKGVASMIGLFAAFDFKILAICGIPALILLAITRYVSLASITYMTLLIIVVSVFFAPISGWEVIAITAFLALLNIYRHKANIQRLLKGCERKIGEKAEVTEKK